MRTYFLFYGGVVVCIECDLPAFVDYVVLRDGTILLSASLTPQRRSDVMQKALRCAEALRIRGDLRSPAVPGCCYDEQERKG